MKQNCRKHRSKLALLVLGFCIVVTNASCEKHVSFSDTQNNYIVSSKNAIKTENKRIASISTQATEIICDLGCMDRLVCRTDFCDFPKEARNIVSIGGVNNPNIEKIIGLQPDIVVGTSMLPVKLFSAMEDAGLPIISFRESAKIEGMYNVISILGKIVQKESMADSIINDCKQRLQIVEARCDSLRSAKKIAKPTVYYVVGYGASGDFSAGKDTYIDEIFALAGADNIAKNNNKWSFSKEELLKAQPEYIFIRNEDIKQFCNTHPYNELKAVKDGRVVGISGLDAQTPRSISAIEFIANTIYGE